MRTIRCLGAACAVLAAIHLCGCGGSSTPPAKTTATTSTGTTPQAEPAVPAIPTQPSTPSTDQGFGTGAQPGGRTVAAQPTQPPSEPAATPAELLQKAQRLARQGDIPSAISALEEVVTADPKHREALSALSQVTQAQAMQLAQGGDREKAYPLFIKSADYAKKLRAAHPKLDAQESRIVPIILYKEACAESLAGNADKGIAALGDAIDSGFSDLNQIAKDADLDPLRESAEFKKLIEEAPERILAKARAHAKELIAEHKPFDFDFALSNLDGETVALKDFAGKVLIVDIWGTWCPPCKMEIPHFVELHKKYKEAGLEIVGINYERVAPEKVNETIKNFVTDNNMTYACVIGDDKTREQVPDFSGFPTTLFIDRSGKVRLSVVGYHELTDLEAIVSTLLAEKPGAPVAN